MINHAKEANDPWVDYYIRMRKLHTCDVAIALCNEYNDHGGD